MNDFIEGGQPTDELSAIIGNIEARSLGDFIKVDYRIIRGLAYYTGPVYEAFDKRGKFRAIAGGGRYDHLVNLVSGGKTDLPALGFGMGDVVLAELLKDRGLLPPLGQALDASCRSPMKPRNASLASCSNLLAGPATEYLPGQPKTKRSLELKAKWLITLQDDNKPPSKTPRPERNNPAPSLKYRIGSIRFYSRRWTRCRHREMHGHHGQTPGASFAGGRKKEGCR